MGTLPQDLRCRLRMLARNPGFSAVAFIALAVDIGANAVMFGWTGRYPSTTLNSCTQ